MAKSMLLVRVVYLRLVHETDDLDINSEISVWML